MSFGLSTNTRPLQAWKVAVSSCLLLPENWSCGELWFMLVVKSNRGFNNNRFFKTFMTLLLICFFLFKGFCSSGSYVMIMRDYLLLFFRYTCWHAELSSILYLSKKIIMPKKAVRQKNVSLISSKWFWNGFCVFSEVVPQSGHLPGVNVLYRDKLLLKKEHAWSAKPFPANLNKLSKVSNSGRPDNRWLSSKLFLLKVFFS